MNAELYFANELVNTDNRVQLPILFAIYHKNKSHVFFFYYYYFYDLSFYINNYNFNKLC